MIYNRFHWLGLVGLIVLCGCAHVELTPGAAKLTTIRTRQIPTDCTVVETITSEPRDPSSFKTLAIKSRNKAAELGANAVHFEEIEDNGLKVTAYQCSDITRAVFSGAVKAARVESVDRVPGNCTSIGEIETKNASSVIDAKHVLSERAVEMGANFVRMETTGKTLGVFQQVLYTMSGVAYYCK